MTGLKGNRHIYLPLKIQDSGVFIYHGTAEVNRNFWGGDPESQGANR